MSRRPSTTLGRVVASLAVLFNVLSMQSAVAQPKVIDTFEVGPSVFVRALKSDVTRGSMWVGTSVGVHEVDLKSLKPRNTFTRNDGLANEYVLAVGIDRDGYKWFGTSSGGASRYKDGIWKSYFPMHGLADFWVYAFASQKNGAMWIGTWAGVSRFDLTTGKFTNYVKELINERVYSIAIDTQDRAWFGTEGGVSMFDGKKWSSWTQKDGVGAPNSQQLLARTNPAAGTQTRPDVIVPNDDNPTYNANYIFAVHIAADKSVWAGTWGGGVARFDGTRWSNFTAKDGLAGNVVYTIVQDKSGAMWFGTDKGVTRFDGKRWDVIGKAQGLLENHVYTLAIAPNGEIWAGSKRGVTRIKP